ncbi:hypothetical protein A3F66_03280 [candidate division TM6 bacterium RIFCSPHIGHO2_12_FULL_32_22]|nr:MAG: hypothetical protein A3F66_03280 [candidate division TM6 bacterium RIFCSPHIGHO2_12_FULL_32_22]
MLKKIICLFTLFLTINSIASDRAFASGILRENRKPTGLSDALLSREEFIYENRDIKHQISKFIQTKEILSLWRQNKIDKFAALRDFFVAVNQHYMDADYVKQEFRELVRANSHIFNNDLDNLFSFANSLLKIRKVDERIIEILNEIGTDLQHQINLGHILINSIDAENFEYAKELIKNGAAVNINAYVIITKTIISRNIKFLKTIEQVDKCYIYNYRNFFNNLVRHNRFIATLLSLPAIKFYLSIPDIDEQDIRNLLEHALFLNKSAVKIEIIQLLLSKCETRNLSLKDDVLKFIIEDNEHEILKLLIDNGLKVLPQHLAIATEHGHVETIKLLLEHVELKTETIGWIICWSLSENSRTCDAAEYLLSTTKRYKTIDSYRLLNKVNEILECAQRSGEKRSCEILKKLKLTKRLKLEIAAKYSTIVLVAGIIGYCANFIGRAR